MVVIETDMIVALASESDKHHHEARTLLRKLSNIKLSPYSLIELDLLLASGNIVVKAKLFYEALKSVLAYYNISVLKPDPLHFAVAWNFRKKYGLTFFDSLHAAVAVRENDMLVSFDRKYSIVKELKYVHPLSLLESA
ncbi:MAG: hypothetical protein DRZ82_08210 [Thermoprotei archaeon]|nr:MAG: hypothetical protein DRZ82_08210 [Thermoprotei archaeon]